MRGISGRTVAGNRVSRMHVRSRWYAQLGESIRPVLGLDQQLQELAEPCVGKGAESLRGIRLPSSPAQHFEDGEEAGTIVRPTAPINVVLEIGRQSASPDAGVQGGIGRDSTAAHQKVDKTVPRDKQQASLTELALRLVQRFLKVNRQVSTVQRDLVDKNPGIEIRDLLGDERDGPVDCLPLEDDQKDLDWELLGQFGECVDDDPVTLRQGPGLESDLGIGALQPVVEMVAWSEGLVLYQPLSQGMAKVSTPFSRELALDVCCFRNEIVQVSVEVCSDIFEEPGAQFAGVARGIIVWPSAVSHISMSLAASSKSAG